MNPDDWHPEPMPGDCPHTFKEHSAVAIMASAHSLAWNSIGSIPVMVAAA